MRNHKYSVIVFDLGNVLIPFNYNILLSKLNLIEEGLGEKFFTLYKDNYQFHRQHEKSEIKSDDFISIMLKWLNYKVTSEEFCEIYSSIFTLNEEVAGLLPHLKKKYKLVLLSNTNYIHMKYGWEGYDFLRHFDKLILSHEVGAIKPEEKIYKAVEEFTKRPSGEHLFIDDIAEYADGAKKLSWDAIQFINYPQLISELKERNIRF